MAVLRLSLYSDVSYTLKVSWLHLVLLDKPTFSCFHGSFIYSW